jgi:hypothetical protein
VSRLLPGAKVAANIIDISTDALKVRVRAIIACMVFVTLLFFIKLPNFPLTQFDLFS